MGSELSRRRMIQMLYRFPAPAGGAEVLISWKSDIATASLSITSSPSPCPCPPVSLSLKSPIRPPFLCPSRLSDSTLHVRATRRDTTAGRFPPFFRLGSKLWQRQWDPKTKHLNPHCPSLSPASSFPSSTQ